MRYVNSKGFIFTFTSEPPLHNFLFICLLSFNSHSRFSHTLFNPCEFLFLFLPFLRILFHFACLIRKKFVAKICPKWEKKETTHMKSEGESEWKAVKSESMGWWLTRNFSLSCFLWQIFCDGFLDLKRWNHFCKWRSPQRNFHQRRI